MAASPWARRLRYVGFVLLGALAGGALGIWRDVVEAAAWEAAHPAGARRFYLPVWPLTGVIVGALIAAIVLAFHTSNRPSSGVRS